MDKPEVKKQPSVLQSPKDPRSEPYHKFNPFSRIFFCWVEPLFWYGFRHVLQHKDLYAHPAEADTMYLLEKFKRHWMVEVNRQRSGGRAFLSIALMKCIWWPMLLHNMFLVVEVVVFISVPFFLGSITSYLGIESPSDLETREAYLNVFGLIIVILCHVIVLAMGSFLGYKTGMIIRIIFTAAIYNKTLVLSQSTVSSLTIGHIVNLASNDVHRFDVIVLYYPFLWLGPVFICCAAVVLYYETGWVAFIAIGLVIVQVPVQTVLSKMLSSFRLKAAKVTDERVKVMNEVITGIRVIKLYGWENAFHRLVARIRHNEMMIILKSSVIRAINLSSYSTALPTMTFVVFSIYAGLGECITLRTVFVTLSLLSSARLMSNFLFVTAIGYLPEAYVAIKRIQKFLLLNELQDYNYKEKPLPLNTSLSNCKTKGLKESSNSAGPCVSVNGLCASWPNKAGSNEECFLLKDITFKVDQDRSLLAVTGPVGSGKSTLLQCLLGELAPTRGTIDMEGTVVYAGQEPWVFSATLRDNILFGQPYESEWFATVVDACALDKDIGILPEGDLTLVGERGVTLSGGQKARVGLARAVYRRAGIYLLDDPLSAVDAAVSQHIFNRCIKELLTKWSVVILVTHQIHYVRQCDTVLQIKENCVEVCKDPSVIRGQDSESLLEEEQDDEDQFAIRKFSIANSEIKNEFSPSLSELKEAPEDINYEDETSDTTADASLSKNINCSHQSPSTDMQHRSSQSSKQEEEERAEGSISFKTYHEYFKAGGGSLYTFGMFAIFLLAEVTVVISDGWLADWADEGSRTCAIDNTADDNFSNTSTSATDISTISTDVRIGVYGGLLVVVWILCIARTVLFYTILLRAATFLHNKMFISVLRSPILFFDTNPVGRILNRFSKDVGFLDDILIYIFCEFLQLFTRFLAIVVTTTIAVYYLLPVIVLMVILFTIFRWYFLKTAREIKRLESIARSPIYSHISMTLQGLPTIRAYEKQNDLLEAFCEYQNKHTQAWYLYIVTARWFGMRIDTICFIYISLLAFVSISLTGVLDAGFVGLALTYSLTLTGIFQFCVRQSADVESFMVSAERVMQYGKLKSEEDKEAPTHPPKNWPDKGHIEISDLCYKHSSDGPLVLHNINCTIESGEKIGIVGRTGAGKSSLIASFFRLAQPNGSIRIDGVECLNIGLHDLRPNISIIPQDPVLFSGTVRYNLDPFSQYDDQQIWTALKQVQLSGIVQSLEGELDAVVIEGGNNFSVGQKQLFCLARALLRHNKILMLDEATANVDLETDSIIQQVIREMFSEYTVLTIAHRLNTVMDSDKIMVLRGGDLLEYGEPYDLLCNPESYLLKLVEQTGTKAAEKLKDIAYNVHSAKTGRKL